MDFPLNHDLHLHTQLSLCSRDPAQNPAAMVAAARRWGYSDLCITDHFWDEAVPGGIEWYGHQGYAHITQNLPLPSTDGSLRLMFGCETDYCGGTKLGVSKERAADFDFVVIAPNHYHVVGFTRDPSVSSLQDVASLFGRRLVALTRLDMPWRKIGIAHLTCSLGYPGGDHFAMYRAVDRGCLKEAFAFFAEKGTGIELNDGCFAKPEALLPENLELYFLAKAAGCKFYRASDAHHPGQMPITPGVVSAARLLGLTAADRYTVPPKA